MKRIVLLFGFAFFFSFLMVNPAFSAEAASGLEVEAYVIDLQPVLGDIIMGLAALFAAVAGWLMSGLLYMLKSKYKLEVDDKVRAYLDVALYTAIGWAKGKALEKSSDFENPHVKNQLIADAVNYALARVPDAIKHFKITEAGLREMIEARLPDVFAAEESKSAGDRAAAEQGAGVSP